MILKDNHLFILICGKIASLVEKYWINKEERYTNLIETHEFDIIRYFSVDNN